MLTKDKTLRAEIGRLIADGWTVTRRGKHAVLRAPNGHTIGVPHTPSDRRAALNWIAQARKVAAR